MKEQLALYGAKLLKNLDRVAVGAFVALVLVAGFLLYREGSYSPPEMNPGSSPPFQEKIPDADGNYERLQRNYFKAQTDIAKDENLKRLVAINMFDAQSVKGQAQLAKEVEIDYQKAEKAFETKNYPEASSLVESILRRNPSHRRTLELKNQIQAALAPPPSEGSTPAPGETPAAPAPAPGS